MMNQNETFSILFCLNEKTNSCKRKKKMKTNKSMCFRSLNSLGIVLIMVSWYVFVYFELDDEGLMFGWAHFCTSISMYIQFEFYFPNLTVDPPKPGESQRSNTTREREFMRYVCFGYNLLQRIQCAASANRFLLLSIYAHTL